MRQKFSRTSHRFVLIHLLQYIGQPLYYVCASVFLGSWLVSMWFISKFFDFFRFSFFTQTQTTGNKEYALQPIKNSFTHKSTVVANFFLHVLLSFIKLLTSVITFLFKNIILFFVTLFSFFFSSRVGKSLTTLAITVGLISTTAWFIYEFIFQDLPSPLEVSRKEKILTTRIYDRHGKELYSIFKDENRTLVPLSDLPPHVINATLAIEDADFFQHPGFSPKGILRAVKVNFTEGKVQGGSTITQQLVKNILLTSEKKYKRKLREVLLAIAVDALYTKDEILSMYFNQISYGGAIYGIEQASLKYFGKHAKDLTVSEAALLAAIPAAPTTYSPFGNNPELVFKRQHEVLRRMVEEQHITPELANQAMTEELIFNENKTDILAPHFVMYVRSILDEQYGETMVSQGGLEVYTTLDFSLQQTAQQIVTEEIEQLKGFRISNGSALVTEPQTGEILAMVGSTNYFDIEHDGQVNITDRLRLPGSSIKPLTYAIALENGMTPATTIEDAPITYSIPGSPPYSPQNYDGKFHGKVRIREALANSYNIPAVKTLSVIGIDKMIDKGKLMGIDTWNDRSRFGLSLTLGGGEVKMTDMAELYGTFANNGQTVELNPILLIKNSEGKILYENPCVNVSLDCEKRRSLDPRVAYQITDILSDNQARSSAFGTNSVLSIPNQQVAVKTGTTNSLRDNWTIGYTTERVVAVWVGNNDNTPMSYVASGITGASPIWNKIIRTQLHEESPHVFAQPTQLIKVAICTTTGTLACEGCPSTKEEYFLPGTEPNQKCVANQFRKKEDKPI